MPKGCYLLLMSSAPRLQVGNFSQVVVRAAGHIVPGDQPERAMDMIKRFVEGRRYEHLPDPVKPPAHFEL